MDQFTSLSGQMQQLLRILEKAPTPQAVDQAAQCIVHAGMMPIMNTAPHSPFYNLLAQGLHHSAPGSAARTQLLEYANIYAGDDAVDRDYDRHAAYLGLYMNHAPQDGSIYLNYRLHLPHYAALAARHGAYDAVSSYCTLVHTHGALADGPRTAFAKLALQAAEEALGHQSPKAAFDTFSIAAAMLPPESGPQRYAAAMRDLTESVASTVRHTQPYGQDRVDTYVALRCTPGWVEETRATARAQVAAAQPA